MKPLDIWIGVTIAGLLLAVTGLVMEVRKYRGGRIGGGELLADIIGFLALVACPIVLELTDHWNVLPDGGILIAIWLAVMIHIRRRRLRRDGHGTAE